jgi:hypothetical protein
MSEMCIIPYCKGNFMNMYTQDVFFYLGFIITPFVRYYYEAIIDIQRRML